VIQKGARADDAFDARARSASANRKSAGSATVRSGAPGARGASAWSSGDTVSIAAATKASTE